jgi:hypothetical protein
MSEVVEAEVVQDMEEPERKGSSITVRKPSSIPQADELTVEQVLEQVEKIQQVTQRAMTNGEHYGVIPGTNKPTLLKPGAEKLCLTFRLAPEYAFRETWHEDSDHYTVAATCRLIHSPTGNFIASGEGLCSTKEAKYAYRNANRVCPVCGVEAIIKGKAEYGGGWVCFKRKEGCGAKFDEGDQRITGQKVGRVPNPDLPDTYNTVLKMACKRALVAAVLNGTAASDIFTQDIEERQAAAEPEPAPQPVDRKWLDDAVLKYGEGPILEAARALWPDRHIWSVGNLADLPDEFRPTLLDHADALAQPKEKPKQETLREEKA